MAKRETLRKRMILAWAVLLLCQGTVAPVAALETLTPLIGQDRVMEEEKEVEEGMPPEYQMVLDAYQSVLGGAEEYTKERLEELGISPLLVNLTGEEGKKVGFYLEDIGEDHKKIGLTGRPAHWSIRRRSVCNRWNL